MTLEILSRNYFVTIAVAMFNIDKKLITPNIFGTVNHKCIYYF